METLCASADDGNQGLGRIAPRERLKTPKVRTREWEGAARLHVRSVDELREAKGRRAASEGHGLGTKVMG